MSRFRFLLLLLVTFVPAIAFSRAAQADWIDDVRRGGYVIVIRHGATFSNQADTDPLNIKNVAAQRQLNDQGRAQAKAMGESMRALKIPVGTVVTSMFQRAVETGTLLGFGEVKSTFDVTEGGLVVTPDENTRRTQALRKLAGTVQPAGSVIKLPDTVGEGHHVRGKEQRLPVRIPPEQPLTAAMVRDAPRFAATYRHDV